MCSRCNRNPLLQVTIGRLPENHLAIPSDFVSGDHAHLEWNSDSRQWFLVWFPFTLFNMFFSIYLYAQFLLLVMSAMYVIFQSNRNP